MRSPIDVDCTIQLSDALYDLTTSRRVWNRLEKEALNEELVHHHEHRIPERFRQDARDTFHHQKRNPNYLAYKNRVYKSRRDLVKAGLSENRITRQRRITIEGSATGGKTKGPGLIGHLIMQFAFPGTRDTKPGHVTLDQMKKEITATTDAEQQAISTGFGMRLVRKLRTYSGGLRRVYRSA